jgi:AraC-like DNA-binding protein
MTFKEYTPAKALQPYIEAYWIRWSRSQTTARRVYADGCADLMRNAGEATVFFAPKADTGESIPLRPGVLYVGGTMSAYGVVRGGPCRVTGVRFRPGGLFALYRTPMKAAVDRLVEFRDPALEAELAAEEGLADRLDAYFGARPRFGHRDFGAIYQQILDSPGQLSVEDLASACHVSRRTLERVFLEYTGIPAKQYIRIVRFRQVLERLREAGNPESLLRIAYDFGYTDHAHLTNEFKQYAGILPSELSHFYKTGISRGQYF